MIGIYKIISPKEKVYVGQSTNIRSRWLHYTSLDCADQPKLYNSFIKYGVDKHKFEILEECSIKQLNERERYWQEKYNVVEEGLNCKLVQTEDKSGYHSEETKRKISIANKGQTSPMKGRRHSEETKLKMSMSQKGKTRRKKSFKKRRVSEETKRKISLAKKGKPSVNRRIIIQLDLNGNIVKEWSSITEAQNTTRFMGIATALVGRSKSSGGFLWKYKEDMV